MKLFLKSLNTSNGILALTVTLLVLIALFSEFRKIYFKNKETKTKIISNQEFEKNHATSYQTANNSNSVDTFIPKDHVLIPIEIENISALNALIDKFSLADLYKTSATDASDVSERGGELIVSNIKLLRAPLDPNEFAVLIHKSRAKWLMKIGFKYRVVLRNYKNSHPDSINPEFFEPTSIFKQETTKNEPAEKKALPVQQSGNRFKTEPIKVDYQFN
jgi:hypothetical protein